MVDKSRLGKRYTCFKCGVKFYDLNRPEPICPACGVDQRDDNAPDPKIALIAKYKAATKAGKGAARELELDDDLPGVEDDDDDEGMFEEDAGGGGDFDE